MTRIDRGAHCLKDTATVVTFNSAHVNQLPQTLHCMNFDFKQTRIAALRLRSVNNSQRQLIIALLEKRGEMDVTSIYKALKVEQSVVSLHLSVLRRSRIVTTRRDGKFIYYSLNQDTLNELIKAAGIIIRV